VAASKEQWKAAKVHTVTLPSSAVVNITLPDLAAMIKGGQIPNALLDVAQKVGTGQPVVAPEGTDADKDEASKELFGEISEFHAFLVSETVVDPKVTPEEVQAGELPAQDVAVLVQFALRERDMDAVGHHLGGLETVDEFRKFRGLDASIEDLLGS
jgi:hypothetical protein